MQCTSLGRDVDDWNGLETPEHPTRSRGGAARTVAGLGGRELERELKTESERPSIVERIRDLPEVWRRQFAARLGELRVIEEV